MDVQNFKRNCKLIQVLAVCILAFCACDDTIYDYEGDCSVNYRVKFRYDYNMKYADAFAHEVNAVTLYVLDKDNQVVWQCTEYGDTLASEDYAMTVNVAPGEYSLLAWCGTTEKGSFSIPRTSVGEELTCMLNRKYSLDGTAYVDEDLDRLFYGYLPLQEFTDTEGTYTYTMPLVKNTNNIRVVLQHLSGKAVDKDKFEFVIYDNNGKIDWNNALLPDEPLTYRAWRIDDGEVGFEESERIMQSESVARSVYSAAIAELTVARLVKGQNPRLAVNNKENGKVVLSIPLIDYALLVKGFYNRDMDDQEYLDRQDTYDMVFFLDERDNWLDSYIYINSWKVVLQNTEL